MSRPRAVVAMSGGVDSSVAAALLVEAGYDVTGIMLKLWREGGENNDSGCCNVGAASDARRVADVLGIPFYVFNLADDFERTVIADFRDAYARGLTPNPCVRCNQWIKFDALLQRATALGAEVLATGHYAQVESTGDRYRLLRGVDRVKDQSYVLWMLSQEQLARVRFPVGGMTKPETRAVAERLGLRTAHKPDSQEICFVRQGEVGGFVAQDGDVGSGPIVDGAGMTVGQHRGLGNYTIGQRKGLGVALGTPVFVTSIDAASNEVRIGPRSELLVDTITIDEVCSTGHLPSVGSHVLVQYRSHGTVTPAVITTQSGPRLRLDLDEPVEAVAPGQSLALYDLANLELLGGGVISAAARERVVA